MKNMDSKDLHREQTNKRRRRKWYYTVSVAMAAVVVFCTVYALILPAITMEKSQQTLSCPLSVHQHTEQCYDSENNLICGEADFVIHTHDCNCFDKDNNQVCKLLNVVKHRHSNSCYDGKEKLICELPEAEEHKHSDLCYDKDGTLICGKLHTIEHVHGAACFKSAGNTDDTVFKDDITPLSDTAETANSDEDASSVEDVSSAENAGSASEARSGETYGYGEDGSIWWGGLSDTQFGADEIQENTPYIISGYEGNNLMADETYTKEGYSYLKAIPWSQMTDYKQYERWYFEKTNGDGKYYIYFLKTNEDGSTTPLYLQYAGEGVVEWNKKTQQTVLTNDKTQATVFTVAKCTDSTYPKHITVSADVDGETFYLNSYFGDKPESNGNTTHWLGYVEYSEGSFLRVSQYNPNTNNTAKRVTTDISPNSVINLFDYWLTPNRFDPDGVDPAHNHTLLESGINKDHAFKFTKGTKSGSYDLNYWTGAGQMPRQGVVAPNLENGYPVLSGNNDINGTTSTESLEYLFNPSYEHEGKVSYRNVGGLLTLDNEDYYSYDCYKNMAEFNDNEKNIYLYDKPGVTGSGDKGQFFPFNKAPQIMTAGRTDSVMNHYFGMTITTRFIQRHGGYTSSDKNTKTTFHFSGDDDVWIFIDGVLVGDVGGIHDASSIDIDFATGEVKVAVVGREGVSKTTNIRDCYKNAGKENSVSWNGNTYADNTTHTLKFYYLERGNYASNLSLKFNLIEIPRTEIHKTNEYGEGLEGAKFAIYAAESEGQAGSDVSDVEYHMLDNKGGARVNLPKEVTYDENGNILDSSGNILAHALYVGTTNKDGNLEFLDQDSMPYTINELNDLFGDTFILREIKVPKGYRIVSEDVNLRIFKGENQKVIICENYKISGTRAATDLQITATDTIHLRKAYAGEATYKEESLKGRTYIPYCDPETGTPIGTLFAVVMKYTGDIDAEGNITGSVSDEHCWTPVYGNDEKGYTLIDMSNDKGIVTASIEAANAAVQMAEKDIAENPERYPDINPNTKYEGVVFSHSKSKITMQLFMNNLPGHIKDYYSMLSTENKSKTRYTVGYYWTDASSLEGATPQNTYGVNTYPSVLESGRQYSGFDRVFSAEIQTPNLLNDLYVQKFDENNNFLDGATFAAYEVKQADNGEILYLAKAEDGTESYITLPKDAKPDKDTGVITVDGKTITPPEIDGKPAVAVTGNLEDGIHNEGTVKFKGFTAGQYIVKEVNPPPGYHLNTSDIMVLVTGDTIYANAGTENDGITVGRGPGYLVTPLHSLASEGQIDNTLTWIYAKMRISKPSTSFADIFDDNMFKDSYKVGEGEETIIGDRYLMTNNSGEVTYEESKIFRANLKFASGKEGTAFNYVPDPDRNAGTDSDGYRRLFTTVGWPDYQIYQDYNYGKDIAKANKANYMNWSGDQITNLFSRSTYVRVTDPKVTLRVKKVDSSNAEVLLSDAQFRLYRLNKNNEKEYYVKEKIKVIEDTTVSGGNNETKYEERVSWNTDAAKAFVVTTGEDGMSVKPASPDPNDERAAPTPDFTELHDGTYYLEEIKAPNGYSPINPVELKIERSEVTLTSSSSCSVSEEHNAETNLYNYTLLTVPNVTGFELPATGGGGTFMYTAGGILLISISLVFGYRRKRKSERRYK